MMLVAFAFGRIYRRMCGIEPLSRRCTMLTGLDFAIPVGSSLFDCEYAPVAF